MSRFSTCLVFGSALAVAQPCVAALFMGLGDLAGGSSFSEAYGVSGDGSVVVGRSISGSGFEAFRWTVGGGMVGLGDLPGGDFNGNALGVSADGSVIVGQSSSTNSGSGTTPGGKDRTEAFLWTPVGGMAGLGDLSGGIFLSGARDVSADGSVVVGFGVSGSGTEAFRWTQAGGLVGLGDLPGGSFVSEAFGVSDDGSVVVGFGTPGVGTGGAFRWTQSSGMVSLGNLPGGTFGSASLGVSANGAVVVGIGGRPTFSEREAFRWSGGMVGLGDLPGSPFHSQSFAASADGSVLVGQGNGGSGNGAFIWDATNGMRVLQDVLVNEYALGPQLAGWTLSSAQDISSDGQVIVGIGRNPSGQTEAWLASLDSISAVPEPSSLALCASGIAGILGLHWTRRRQVPSSVVGDAITRSTQKDKSKNGS